MQQMGEGELRALEVLLQEGYSIPRAAQVLGRNKTTIYRLFQTNGVLYNQPKWKYIGGMIRFGVFRRKRATKICSSH